MFRVPGYCSGRVKGWLGSVRGPGGVLQGGSVARGVADSGMIWTRE